MSQIIRASMMQDRKTEGLQLIHTQNIECSQRDWGGLGVLVVCCCRKFKERPEEELAMNTPSHDKVQLGMVELLLSTEHL